MSYVNTFSTVEESIIACVDYDPVTGLAYWLPRVGDSLADTCFNRQYAYKEISNICPNGYKRFTFTYKGKVRSFKLHRVAFLFETGRWPSQYVDHINGNKLDNRFINLREVNAQQNTWNRATPRTSKTGHKGVDIVKGKFRARGFKNGERVVLGTFPTKEEAIKAYESFTKGFQNEYYRV